jgi:hypothetical protein
MPQPQAVRQRDKMFLMGKPNGAAGDVLISAPEELHRRKERMFALMEILIAIGVPRIHRFSNVTAFRASSIGPTMSS